MPLFKVPAVIDALDDLLDRERGAILRGELETLTRLAPEKERLMQRLPAEPGDVARVERLRQKAGRNQELLAAVAGGIRRAVQRLEALSAPATGLSTYGHDGAKRDLARKARKFERRA